MATAKRKDAVTGARDADGDGERVAKRGRSYVSVYSDQVSRSQSAPTNLSDREGNPSAMTIYPLPEKIQHGSSDPGSKGRNRPDFGLVSDTYGVRMPPAAPPKKPRRKGTARVERVRGPLGDSLYRQVSYAFGPTKGPLGDSHGRDYELI
mmetsp:Transcript_25226/g.47077  ORF Transcript_25226/g.47077 Transcript_25226/m.47077 type:complete len:150 (-) Transcript_25226:481-930(-)|eukprot:CAMPEP_0170179246 /NCGR_PEP_ID=MMETSP0040_2-20121228/17049_1 /TAXON_ID=641309 /ORGANISM="Lotharella oceanica, Strain CCMP622" /LENGTH=149 /DNA_ID=CAMNT_0010423199 /DNA_START=36 /DNA_END=485 /DNA_ORIENTATION=+